MAIEIYGQQAQVITSPGTQNISVDSVNTQVMVTTPRPNITVDAVYTQVLVKVDWATSISGEPILQRLPNGEWVTLHMVGSI